MNFAGLLAHLEVEVEARIAAILHPGIASALNAGPKGHADLSHFLPAPFNQGRSSTCWAHAAAAAFHGAHAIAGKPLYAPPSPLYFAQCVYGARGGPLLDTGASLPEAAKAFASLGEVPLQGHQQDGNTDVPATVDASGNYLEIPPATPADTAKGHLAAFEGEYAISVDEAAPLVIMAALDAGMYVWDGFLVDKAFEDLAPNAVLGAPAGATLGGHSTLYWGYDVTPLGPIFKKRNSWGKSWCRGGDFSVSSAHVLKSWALWPFAVRVP